MPAADPAGAPAVELVEPVGEDPPTPHPGVDEPDEVAEPVVEVDPMTARIAELTSAARAEGRSVGRRTVARELGVTEYRAGRLLARTNSNGTTGGRP